MLRIKMPNKPNLLAFDRQALAQYFESLGEQPFRAQQLFKWMHQEFETDFNQMSNISKALRQRLAEEACIQLPKLEQSHVSSDGTRKWLMRLADGNGVEVVLIPEQERATLCISSQVGCSLNCSFCATGRQGYNRNLDAGEIVGQVRLAWQVLEAEKQGEKVFQGEGKDPRPITNIVFMGMGEPLLNYDEVTKAIRILLDDFAYGMSKRRITLSTAGVVPQMARLAAELPVTLAVSLHAGDDALRNELVPLNKKYPIDVLLQACRDFIGDRARERVTFEYLLLDGVNDSAQQAHDLGRLLKDVPGKVNLIPYNPVENLPYRRSTRQRVNAFKDILMQHGIITMIRKTRGDDIDAACGQLVGKVDDRTRRAERLKVKLNADAA